LCKPGNAERFLAYLGCACEIEPEFGIYFEYAYLRDLWHRIAGEEPKRAIIRGLLPINRIDSIAQLPMEQINRVFGATPKASRTTIQNPRTWSVGRFHKNFENNDDFLRICRFKWSFNIKPDIVIHLNRDSAVCIEAKHSSGEGHYPSSSQEKAIFRERGLSFVGQTDLQKYMMEDLLGIDSEFVLLVTKALDSRTHRVITWKEAFASIDMSEMPRFAMEMARRVWLIQLYNLVNQKWEEPLNKAMPMSAKPSTG
jgi:hypothetical protein